MHPNKDKKDFVEKEYKKLTRIALKAIDKKNYEKSLAAISACGNMLYEWNQSYTDELLERSLSIIAQKTASEEMTTFVSNPSVAFFYDDFGLDIRGLALIYLKALEKTGKRIVYVTVDSAKNNQPEIDKVANAGNIIKEYFPKRGGYIKRLSRLQQLMLQYKPGYAFLYTGPGDTAGITLFMQLRGVTRYQINLTDHAFWLGINSFDYCLEFRNYGAGISKYYRNISEEKLIMIPYYPAIDKKAAFCGFPFNAEGKKIIFSGGGLYKTIDAQGTYYKVIDRLLNENNDVIFVYAGNGDDSHLNKLVKSHPEKVYYIKERNDLYQVLRHSTIYLNTYPIPGGLMTQYAVAAGRIPVTLKHNQDSEGILLEQSTREIEYDSPEDLIRDVNHLLRDADYRRVREKKLEGSIVSEEQFNIQIKKLLDRNQSIFKMETKKVDTSRFLNEYIERFSIEKIQNIIATRRNISLFPDYRNFFKAKILRGVLRRLFRRFV